MNSTENTFPRKPLPALAHYVVDRVICGNPPDVVHVLLTNPTEAMTATAGVDAIVCAPGGNPLAYRWSWAQGHDIEIHVATYEQRALARVLLDHLTEQAVASVGIVGHGETQEAAYAA